MVSTPFCGPSHAVDVWVATNWSICPPFQHACWADHSWDRSNVHSASVVGRVEVERQQLASRAPGPRLGEDPAARPWGRRTRGRPCTSRSSGRRTGSRASGRSTCSTAPRSDPAGATVAALASGVTTAGRQRHAERAGHARHEHFPPCPQARSRDDRRSIVHVRHPFRLVVVLHERRHPGTNPSSSPDKNGDRRARRAAETIETDRSSRSGPACSTASRSPGLPVRMDLDGSL